MAAVLPNLLGLDSKHSSFSEGTGALNRANFGAKSPFNHPGAV
jgi:hypothetical protein